MKKPDEEVTLHIRPGQTEVVTLHIPVDTLATLNNVAASHDMSVQALLKLYIGHGLRQDAPQMYTNRDLELPDEA